MEIFCDGSITGSHWGKKDQKDTPAYGWSGWMVQDGAGYVIHHHSVALGTHELMSANVAEYMAVRSALNWAVRYFQGNVDEEINVYSDSQLVMRQLAGIYQVHNQHLKKLHKGVKDLEARLGRVTYRWIPREKNRYADAMSKCLQPEYGGKIPPCPLPADLLSL